MTSTPLIDRARAAAAGALKDQTRHDGTPFIGHPDAVAAIVADEIGLPEECIAAVYLHEASRIAGYEVREADWGASICTLVDGLNKISTIKPNDTRLEAENYKKLIIQYSRDPRVTVLKLADRLEVMRSLRMFPKSNREQKILETLPGPVEDAVFEYEGDIARAAMLYGMWVMSELLNILNTPAQLGQYILDRMEGLV